MKEFDRVTREPRKHSIRRIPDADGGIRYKDLISRRERSQPVFRNSTLPEISTLFGKISYISRVQGGYEIAMEAMVPKTSTGIIAHPNGYCTIICKAGILYVERHIGENSVQYEKLKSGDVINLIPKEQYALAAGDVNADFIRIQTFDYMKDVVYGTECLPADNQIKENINVISLKEVGADKQIAQIVNVTGRRSYDASYRKQVAEQVASDKKGVNRAVREVRVTVPGKSGDEMFQEQMDFAYGTTTVRGMNPRPLGADGAEALMLGDLAGQIPPSLGNNNG